MHAITSYSALKQNLPSLCQNLEQVYIAKINKSKKKDSFSIKPEDWEWSYSWAQKIQGMTLNEMMNPSKIKTEPATVEEKVYNLFKAGDIAMTIEVKQKGISTSTEFPHFGDENFFIPQEVVNSYDKNSNIQQLDKPTIFVYSEKNKIGALRESYVIGGLKDSKTNKEYVVLQELGENWMAYEVKPDNNLDAKMFVSNKLTIDDFEKSKAVKIGKNIFYTLELNEALELLKGKEQWIEDSQALISLLLGELSSSPGFMSFGQVNKQSRLTKIPSNTPTVLINGEDKQELKTKLKIK